MMSFSIRSWGACRQVGQHGQGKGFNPRSDIGLRQTKDHADLAPSPML
jgi:hypothetical protein